MGHFYRDYLIASGVIKGEQPSGRGRNSLGAYHDAWSEFAGLIDVLWWGMKIFLAGALLVFVVTYWAQILAGAIILGVIALFLANPLVFLVAILIGSFGGD